MGTTTEQELIAWLAERGLVRSERDRCWLPALGAGAFGYTDGESVEKGLFDALAGVTERSVLSTSMRKLIVDWPSRYHFSPLRANLLRPLAPLLKGARVLEIGAGCGALTRFIAEAGATEVLAVEGSLARARIAGLRVEGLGNACVAAAPLQDLDASPRFDVVTLVGVLEYARIFFPAGAMADPVDAMLAHACSFLRPGGTLIVAIENQLGLKYLAGYPEDHVMQPMFGVEDRYELDGVVTFGRRELGRRVADAGLRSQRWLYPFPDYKLPVVVLNETAVSACEEIDLAPLLVGSVVQDYQRPAQTAFALERAWRPVMRNGLGGELANSFLLLASGVAAEVEDDATTLAWHFSVDRAPGFAKQTVFRRGASGVEVHAQRLRTDLPLSVKGLRLNLQPQGFRQGRPWHESLHALLGRRGWATEDVAQWAETWLACVLRDGGLSSSDAVPGCALPGHLVDAVPRNLLMGADGGRFIDLEWELDGGLTLGWLAYRGIVFELSNVVSVSEPAGGTPLDALSLFVGATACMGWFVTEADISAWHASETNLQMAVHDLSAWTSLDELRGCRLRVGAT